VNAIERFLRRAYWRCCLFLLCLQFPALARPLDNWDQIGGLAPAYWIDVSAYGQTLLLCGDEFVLTRTGDGQWHEYKAPSVGFFSSSFGNGLYVVHGGEFGGRFLMLTSTNAIVWTKTYSPVSLPIIKSVFGQGLHVGIGADGAILTSTNGSKWTAQRSGTTHWLNDILFENGTFVAVGGSEDFLGQQEGVALASTNGVDWKVQFRAASLLIAVGYGAGAFVLSGYNGELWRSLDTIDWAPQNNPTTNKVNKFCHFATTFVGVGGNGSIISSRDGIGWVSRRSGGAELNGVAFDGDHVIVAGAQGSLLRSGPISSQPAKLSASFHKPFVLELFGRPTYSYAIEQTREIDAPAWRIVGLINLDSNNVAATWTNGDPRPYPIGFYRSVLLP
jgi:hypothetical protein